MRGFSGQSMASNTLPVRTSTAMLYSSTEREGVKECFPRLDEDGPIRND